AHAYLHSATSRSMYLDELLQILTIMSLPRASERVRVAARFNKTEFRRRKYALVGSPIDNSFYSTDRHDGLGTVDSPDQWYGSGPERCGVTWRRNHFISDEQGAGV